MKKKWMPHIIAVTAFVVFIVLGLACVSVTKAKDADLIYSETVNVPEVSAADLFVKVNLWLINALKEEESKIQRSDISSGVITATHTFWTKWGSKSHPLDTLVLSTITINVKDNGYVLSFSNPIFKCRTIVGPNTPDGWTKTEPLDGTLVNATRDAWYDLAGGLRATVSGKLVKN